MRVIDYKSDLALRAKARDDEAYLRGYRYGASNVRALAGIVEEMDYKATIEKARSTKREKTTRFALGKGRVKFVLTSAIDAFRYAGEIRPYDSYEAGYLEAFLDSVN